MILFSVLSETSIKTSFPSEFSDFQMIADIILHFLGYEFHFFGTSMSISSVIMSCLILSIAIGFVVHTLGGD